MGSGSFPPKTEGEGGAFLAHYGLSLSLCDHVLRVSCHKIGLTVPTAVANISQDWGADSSIDITRAGQGTRGRLFSGDMASRRARIFVSRASFGGPYRLKCLGQSPVYPQYPPVPD